MGCGQTMKVRQWDIATAIDGKKNGEWVHVKKIRGKSPQVSCSASEGPLNVLFTESTIFLNEFVTCAPLDIFQKSNLFLYFVIFPFAKQDLYFCVFWFALIGSGWLHLYYLSHMIVFALVFCVLRSFCNSIFFAFLYLLWRSAVPRLVAVHLYCLSRMTALRIHKNFEI